MLRQFSVKAKVLRDIRASGGDHERWVAGKPGRKRGRRALGGTVLDDRAGLLPQRLGRVDGLRPSFEDHVEVRRTPKVLPEEGLPIDADNRKLRDSADRL